MSTVRVRYAPSPTGHLHIGGVRTALFNYLYARHYGGHFILRIEDTDLERNVPGAEAEMIRGFQWLGLQWDEGPDVGGPYGPYRCTERLDTYQFYLQKLVDSEQAYPCFCSEERLIEERERQIADGKVPAYDGHCRHLSPAERERQLQAGLRPSWRLAVPSGVDIEFHDLIRGDVRFQSDDIGDFVIMKSNGIPIYHFQVVVDDALMKITHVIRGEEHLSNTPKHWLIMRALDFAQPTFAHLPQVLDHNRKKLSKRDPNVKPVHWYREQGYLPEGLTNFLALLGWSPGGEQEIMSMDEIVTLFDLDRVNHSGAVFDVDKLQWMAGQYLKNSPVENLVVLVNEQLQRAGMTLPANRDEAWLSDVVALYRDHLSCAADFLTLSQGFFTQSVDLSEEADEILGEPGALDVVRHYRALTEMETNWTAQASQARFKQVQKELGVKGRALFMPVRAALTGQVHGPDLQETIRLLSKEWVLRRLEEALQDRSRV